MNNFPRFSFAALALLISLSPVTAATNKLDDIYDVAIDINKDGKMDRAVLVAVDAKIGNFYSDKKESYSPGYEERLDLFIYLGTGYEPVDLTKSPSLVGEHIDRIFEGGFISPLAISNKNSLVFSVSTGGASAFSGDYTLTIVDRSGKLMVAGYDYSFETREDAGGCSLNYLSGKGVVEKGINNEISKPLKGLFKLVTLADWTMAKLPHVCGGE